MRSIPAFSKKKSNGPTIGGKGLRTGFTNHVKTTNSGKGKAVPHMAAMYPVASTSGHTGAKGKMGHPSFKSHSGKAAKSVAPFSKKKV